jgi:SAM-dependent methyltransferase
MKHRDEYGLHAYWEQRYSTVRGAADATRADSQEQDHRLTEWLGDYTRYREHVQHALHWARSETSSSTDHTLMKVLVPGCGALCLAEDLKLHDGKDVGVVVAVDYVQSVMDAMREKCQVENVHYVYGDCTDLNGSTINQTMESMEMVKKGDLCKQHDDSDPSMILQSAPYDVVVDKSTLDSITCSDDTARRKQQFKTSTNQCNANHSQEHALNMNAVAYLRQMAALLRPGGVLLVISYSPYREEYFQETHDEWKMETWTRTEVLEQEGGLEASSSSSSTPCYRPPIAFHVYTIQRR